MAFYRACAEDGFGGCATVVCVCLCIRTVVHVQAYVCGMLGTEC